ncbi:MAG: hypothetical protein KAK00_07765 [Nanoarchaeota archaeon]|nr:hypothetical protein [Thermodesulfovibrionia bacterium]MCK5283279.1 hypothetical protein [Nanoarchaeota archaeon]
MAKKKNATKKKEVSKKKKKASKPPISGIKIEITVLKRAPEKRAFILADGRKLKDLRELAFALEDMADEVFWHHVNDTKNDFVNWVEDVFKDKELAESIKNVRDRFNTQLAVLRHIVRKI